MKAGRTQAGEPGRYLTEVVLTYEGDECLIWPYARIANGYAMIRGQYVHRVICEEVKGPPPTTKHQAAHSCGRGKQGCVTKRHLSWKTPLENIADKFIHGTIVRGERVSQGKLTEAQALEIMALKGSMKLKDIGAKYGVSLAAISAIHCGISWAHLSKAEEGLSR